MEAENAPEERRVAPNPWATLSVHVVASPASHGALEGGGISVRSFVVVNFLPRVLRRDPVAGRPPLTPGRHHKTFGSGRTARSPHGLDLAGACFALERAWPAGAGFS